MPTSSSSAPLTAFLRGIEARAFVLIHAQCGDAAAALRALDAAEAAFAAQAATLPLTQWPMRFWGEVLRQPALATTSRLAPPLGAMSSGPRAALLLRLLAGLDAGHAAQALGVGEAAFAHAWERALAELARQGVDPRHLHDELHARAKALPPAQRDALAGMREARAVSALTVPAAAPMSAHRVRLRPVAIAGLALAVLAFAATFLPLGAPHLQPGQSETLPAEGVAAPAALDDATVVMHPDYAQLAAPQDDAVAQRLALWSWMAAGMPTASAAGAPPLAEAAGPESAGSDPDADEGGTP